MIPIDLISTNSSNIPNDSDYSKFDDSNIFQLFHNLALYIKIKQIHHCPLVCSWICLRGFTEIQDAPESGLQ